MAASVRENGDRSARTSSSAHGPASKTNRPNERSTSAARVVPYSTYAAKAMPMRARRMARDRARMDFSVTRAGETPKDRRTAARQAFGVPAGQRGHRQRREAVGTEARRRDRCRRQGVQRIGTPHSSQRCRSGRGIQHQHMRGERAIGRQQLLRQAVAQDRRSHAADDIVPARPEQFAPGAIAQQRGQLGVRAAEQQAGFVEQRRRIARAIARIARRAPPADRTCTALSAALVRGKRSHASALNASCRLPSRVAISPRAAMARSYASARSRERATTKTSGRPSGSASPCSRARPLSVARSGQRPASSHLAKGARPGCRQPGAACAFSACRPAT